MKLKVVKIEIKDYDGEYPILDTYYLVNPNRDKLEELKKMVEGRFDYQFDENLTDAEIKKAEQFVDSIWDYIGSFIKENFVTLDINEVYEIEY